MLKSAIQSLTSESMGGSNMPGRELCLMDILAVYEKYRSCNNWVRSYRQRAEQRDVTHETIRDACTRRLGLNVAEFKQLLRHPEKLREHLCGCFPDLEPMIENAVR